MDPLGQPPSIGLIWNNQCNTTGTWLFEKILVTVCNILEKLAKKQIKPSFKWNKIQASEKTEEEEPEETHWDKGTQTEDDMMDQYLPLKKRPLRIEEESPW